MKRRLISGAIITIWLIAFAWLLRFEAFPEFFSRRLTGYQTLLPSGTLIEDSWVRILADGSPIGYAHNTIETDDSDPARYCTIDTSARLRLNTMGLTQDILLDSKTELNISYLLQQFEVTLRASDYRLRVLGTRAKGHMFDVRMKTADTTQFVKVEIPPDAIMASPMTDMAIKRLRPGQKLAIRVFDPMTLTPRWINTRALRSEPISVSGETVSATVIATEYAGRDFLSWIDQNGSIIKQETPFGWTIERCTPAQAIAAFHDAEYSADVLRALAVPCKGTIAPSEANGPLRLRLTGVAFEEGELESNRQHLESRTRTEAILITRPARRPVTPSPLTDEERAAALISTTAIQADHPEIIAAARRITKGAQNDSERIERIMNWVHDEVHKEMRISLPSALDVLKSMKGDCNEHTYLAVALVRAAGIPAKICVGMAYQGDAFFYHAWPAVYDGAWIEMDPTWGQDLVDSTHIKVIEGEMANQINLMKIIGQLHIEVLADAPKTDKGDIQP